MIAVLKICEIVGNGCNVKNRKGNLFLYFKNICASRPASKMLKTPLKPSYSLVGDLHGMQGVSGSSPLGSIKFKSY